MNYGEYHHSLNRFDRENFEKIIRDSRRFPEVLWERGGRKNIRSLVFIESSFSSGFDKNKYEYREEEYITKSKIRAVQSRNEFPNLLLLEEILFRFYGDFALTLNSAMRKTYIQKTLYISDKAKEYAANCSDKYIDSIEVYSYEDISPLSGLFIPKTLKTRGGLPAIVLTNYINQSITRHGSEHIDADYFYRIARAKKNVYLTSEEASKLPLDTKNTVKLGNVVMDKAITSVGNDLQSVLFRYSHKGQSATLMYFEKTIKNEEEILYVIKNNKKLNYMDIAGFKKERTEINNKGRFERNSNNELLKGHDIISSGELIISSHTPFRVVGIQKMDRTMNRRLVFLEPMKLGEIKQTDIVQNNFNGRPFSRTGRFNLEEFIA